jgi:hypothetical protein
MFGELINNNNNNNTTHARITELMNNFSPGLKRLHDKIFNDFAHLILIEFVLQTGLKFQPDQQG